MDDAVLGVRKVKEKALVWVLISVALLPVIKTGSGMSLSHRAQNELFIELAVDLASEDLSPDPTNS